MSQLDPYIDMIQQVARRRFQNVRSLAATANSRIYIAEDELLNRTVAIKLMDRESLSGQKGYLESQLLASLNHPCVMRILDLIRTEHHLLQVLPYMPGGPVDGPRARNFSEAKKESLALSLVQGLAYVHKQNWLHCDIKPSNILLDEKGLPCLADFGEAQLKLVRNEPAGDKQFVGSIGYMAPELLKQVSSPSVQSDIYSLGVTIFEILTGRKAFDLNSRRAVVDATTVGLPEFTRADKRQITKWRDWRAILSKATAPSAKNRYESAVAMQEDVRRLIEFLPIDAAAPSYLTKWLKWSKREPRIAALGATIFGLLVALMCLSAVAWAWESAELARSQAALTQLETLAQKVSQNLKSLDQALANAQRESAAADASEQATLKAKDNVDQLVANINQQIAQSKRLQQENDQVLEAELAQYMELGREAQVASRIENATAGATTMTFETLYDQRTSKSAPERNQPVLVLRDRRDGWAKFASGMVGTGLTIATDDREFVMLQSNPSQWELRDVGRLEIQENIKWSGIQPLPYTTKTSWGVYPFKSNHTYIVKKRGDKNVGTLALRLKSIDSYTVATPKEYETALGSEVDVDLLKSPSGQLKAVARNTTIVDRHFALLCKACDEVELLDCRLPAVMYLPQDTYRISKLTLDHCENLAASRGSQPVSGPSPSDQLTQLSSVCLINCGSLNQAWWNQLASIQSLISVELGQVTCDTRTATALAQFRSLEELKLDKFEIDQDAMSALATAPALFRLDLTDCDELSASSVAALANMRSLKLLNISNVGLDDAAAEELGGLENLISLRLSATGLRQSGWNWLEKLKGLRELDVSETKNVDNSVVSAIARLPKLQRLDLSATSLTDAGLIALQKVDQLKWLDVSETKCGRNTLEEFRTVRADIQLSYTDAEAAVVDRRVPVPHREPLPDHFRLTVVARHCDFHNVLITADGIESTFNAYSTPVFEINDEVWEPNKLKRLTTVSNKPLMPPDLNFSASRVELVGLNPFCTGGYTIDDKSILLEFGHPPAGVADLVAFVDIPFKKNVPDNMITSGCKWLDAWEINAFAAKGIAGKDIDQLRSLAPVAAQSVDKLDVYLGQSFPAWKKPWPNFPDQNFAMQGERHFDVHPGTYIVEAYCDDGLRVWVDDNLIINAWKNQHTTHYSHVLDLQSAPHTIRFEYYQNQYMARLYLNVRRIK